MRTGKINVLMINLALLTVLVIGSTALAAAQPHSSQQAKPLQSNIQSIPASARSKADTTIDVPLDIVLVQDETGSMGDDIASLGMLAPTIWDSISTMSTAGFRMSVIGFRDFARDPWGDSGDWVYRLVGDFTTSRDDFTAALSQLTADGGNDTPEGQYAALDYLLNSSHPCIDSDGNGTCDDSNDTPAGQQPHFRSGAKRIILLATDAGFHQPDATPEYPGPDRDTLVAALGASRTTVIGLVPGGMGTVPQVDDLTVASGGSTQDTGGSGQDVANAIAAALNAVHPVSPDLSMIGTTPTFVPADGTSVTTVTITLRDTAGAPVTGKSILLYTDRANDIIVQPDNTTDENGQTVGTVASFDPGSVSISAIDITDNIRLTQSAHAEFTEHTFIPGAALANEITVLHTHTSGRLGMLVKDAKEAGQQGDEFRRHFVGDTIEGTLSLVDNVQGLVEIGSAKLGMDAAQQASSFAAPGVEQSGGSAVSRLINAAQQYNVKLDRTKDLFDSELINAAETRNASALTRPIVVGGLQYYAKEYAHDYLKDEVVLPQGSALLAKWFDFLAGQTNALKNQANYTASATEGITGSLSVQRDDLLAGIPAMSDAEQSAYIRDLQARRGVPMALESAINHQVLFLSLLQDGRKSIGGGGIGAFTARFSAKVLSNYFPFVGPLAVNTFLTGFDGYVALKKVEADGQGYLTSLGALKSAAEYAPAIGLNTSQGYYQVAQHVAPQPVTGTLGSVHHYSEGNDWVIKWNERNSYSDVEVTNTSSQEATFQVLVEYGYDSRIFGMKWNYVPLVTTEIASIGPGQTKTIRVHYKSEEQGGSPSEGDHMSFYVLGANKTGVFYVAYRDVPWQPQHIDLRSSRATTAGQLQAPATENLQVIENPINTYIGGDPHTQMYQATIWLTNPFTGTITTNITQTLPANITVLASDGTITDRQIVWNKTIAASDITSATMTFRANVAPGVSSSLPPAAMSFVEPSSGVTLDTQSNVASFVGFWPVTLVGAVPEGVFGHAATLPVSVTNRIDTPVNGSVTVVVSHTTGLTETTLTLPFTVAGSSESRLEFTLPPTIPVGSHVIELRLQVNESTGTMMRDEYIVDGTRLYLPVLTRSG